MKYIQVSRSKKLYVLGSGKQYLIMSTNKNTFDLTPICTRIKASIYVCDGHSVQIDKFMCKDNINKIGVHVS